MLRMRAIARRHAYVLLRSPHRLFDVTLWPLVDVVLFGSLAAFVGTGQATPAAKVSGYLLAGIVLWHVIYQSQIAMSTGLLEETWTRNLLNLMVTPLREVEFVGGVAMFGMVKLCMGVGLMVIGAFAFFSFSTWTLVRASLRSRPCSSSSGGRSRCSSWAWCCASAPARRRWHGA